MDEKSGKRKVYIIGHKNPDTDSICSAIAYAELKNKIGDEHRIFLPKRAGQINSETQFVLNYFQMEAPGYIENVGTRVRDMDIRFVEGAKNNISLKNAWTRMREEHVNTMPITKENRVLEGVITSNDITKSYMDVYDSAILSEARTQYKNIVETLDGKMIIGNPHAYFVKGKVLVAAANPDLMENYIEQDDLVILGNRYESQLCAIEMNASCIVVCEGAPVSRTIQHLAAEKNCVVISTPHDTFTVARLINQSMPVKHFMTKTKLLTFELDDYTDSIKDIMASKRYRYFPVLDCRGAYVGMISRRNLLSVKRRQVILVDHNETSQAVDNIESADILEIIDHHRLGSLETMAPVFFRNQPVGCTATIIYQIYQERNIEIPKQIAGLLCAAILSDTLMFRSPTCTEKDREAVKHLAEIAQIEYESFASEMFEAGSDLKNKSPEEIFYQDFKKFEFDNRTFGVGQINSMNKKELKNIRERLTPYLAKAYESQNLEMLFFMLTDIVNESTELIYYGRGAQSLIEEAFHVTCEEGAVVLKGIVSRKKQLIPAFMGAIQN